MNRVIIPDENVRISTKDIHLDMVTLNTIRDVMIDSVMIEIAIIRGFTLLIIFIVAIDEIIVIFPFVYF